MIKLLFTWADGSTFVEWVNASRFRLRSLPKLLVINDVVSVEILEYAA